MRGYYSEKLSAEKLRKVYDIAPPRVQQYLDAEIAFALDHLESTDHVLELGCGYGRVLGELAAKAALVVGIDSSHESLLMARTPDRAESVRYIIAEMDAAELAFKACVFDVVTCIQNGISAFHIDQRRLIEEALRVVRPGGTVLFSSYADKFWNDRLHWFELQSRHGLLGEIDYDATGDGVIVCTDGFRATTVGPAAFRKLTTGLDADIRLEEVDGSSLFCVMIRK
jgi:SAM-dependent methyltransferase